MPNSLLIAWGATVLRSVVVAVLSCWLGSQWVNVTYNRCPRANWFWGILLLPTLMPPLVVGYAYSETWLTLIRHPWCQEGFYDLILLFRMLPLAVLVGSVAPWPPLGRSGLYCMKLGHQKAGIRWWTHGPGRVKITAGALVFVLVFGEFPIASRFGSLSWGVWIFDAQVGGLSLTETLKALVLPLACQWLVIGIAVLSLGRARQGGGRSMAILKKKLSWAQWLWMTCALGVVCLGPALLLGAQAIRGIPAAWGQQMILPQIGTSLMMATVATGLASVLCLGLTHRSRFWAWGLGLPGAAGSLVVGLVFVSLFQLSGWGELYDTPVPLWLALTVIVLPVGVILGAILGQPASPTHLAKLLKMSPDRKQHQVGKQIHWLLARRASWVVISILFFLAYIDLPASALLAPSGMAPASVRLYNLMHYGRYDTLAAMTAITYACPLLLIACMWLPRLRTMR